MKIQKNKNLKNLNTLYVKSLAKYFVQIKNEKELVELFKTPKYKNNKKFILGSGASVLFLNNFEGMVIKYLGNEIEKIKDTKENVIFKVGGGKNWHEFVEYCVRKGYHGAENLALIPGTVGAAVVQNIAAYGQNAQDIIKGVDCYDLNSGNKVYLDKKECGLSYRNSFFQGKKRGKYLITNVYLELKKKGKINTEYWSNKHGSIKTFMEERFKKPYKLKDIFDAVVMIRTEKFPDTKKFGCAGSFYKNPAVTKKQLKLIMESVPNIQYYPIEKLHYVKKEKITKISSRVKIALGQLLDDGLGLKGHWEGNVGLYEKHALMLVTNKKATSEEVYKFAEKIKKKVKNKFDIKVENEVEYVS